MSAGDTIGEAVDWSEYFGATTPADMKFVLDSWMASFRTSPWAGSVANNLYHDVYRASIQQLLDRGAKVMVVRNAVNRDMIIGWICFELTGSKGELVIHYAYTKPPYRKQGVYRSLVSTLLKHCGQSQYFYTFRTPVCRYLKGCTYRPEIARRQNA